MTYTIDPTKIMETMRKTASRTRSLPCGKSQRSRCRYRRKVDSFTQDSSLMLGILCHIVECFREANPHVVRSWRLRSADPIGSGDSRNRRNAGPSLQDSNAPESSRTPCLQTRRAGLTPPVRLPVGNLTPQQSLRQYHHNREEVMCH